MEGKQEKAMNIVTRYCNLLRESVRGDYRDTLSKIILVYVFVH